MKLSDGIQIWSDKDGNVIVTQRMGIGLWFDGEQVTVCGVSFIEQMIKQYGYKKINTVKPRKSN